MLDDLASSAADGAEARPSALDRAALLAVLKTWFRDDAAHSAHWRTAARDDFDFIAGEQWTAEERAALEGQLRPAIVFNRTLAVVKAVAGSEINTRHDIRFIPRNNEDSAVNEVLTGASRWIPAFATRISMRWKRFTKRSNMRATSASRETSALSATASPPSAAISFTSFSAASAPPR